MKNKYNFKLTILSILYLNIFLLVQCRLDEDNTMKALSCMSIVNKRFKDPKPEVFFEHMLACYVKITIAQSSNILSELTKGIDTLETDEVEDLVSISNLKDLSKKKLRSVSNELERILKELKKIDTDYSKLKEEKPIDESNYFYSYTEDDKTQKRLIYFLAFSLCLMVIYLFWVMIKNSFKSKKNKNIDDDEKKPLNENKEENKDIKEEDNQNKDNEDKDKKE